MKKLALTAALLSGASPLAAAQAQSAQDEIVVTAQRREQSPQDVGVALNVFSGADLVAQGVDRVNGLENITPGLEIENQFGSGQPSFSIRGVGFRDYATNNAPTVGVYVDDVAYPIPVMTQGVLYDVSRVEVLRGPQGTLYGRNTTGGAIKIISNMPTEEFSIGATLEAGRFGRVDGEAYVSGPVAENVRVRLSGAMANGGAWQVSRETGEEIGDAKQYAARGLVAVDLGAGAEALLNIHGFTDNSDGLGLQLFNDSLLDGSLAHERRETTYGSSADFAALTGIAEDAHPFRDNEGWGTSLTLNAPLGAATLTYIGAYEVLNRKEFNDFDALALGGAGVYFQSSADVMSHELRASGETGRFNWVGGLYYSQEDLNELYQSDFAASFGPGFAVSTPYKQKVRTMAAYIHGGYALTDALTIIAGLRYEDETRKLRDLGTFSAGTGPLNFANGTVDGTLENRDLSSDNFSGKVGVELTPAEDILLYAHASRGVKSGGFTAYNTLNPNALTPFLPEKLNAFEIGFKTSFGEMLQLNGAGFYYNYKDQQVQSAIYDAGTGAIVGRIVNADSEIFGAELEAVLTPAPWLTLGQSLAWKTGEFTSFTDLDTAATGSAGMAVYVDRSGQDLGFPNWSYQGFVEAETALAEGWSARARFDYSYRDELSLPLLGPDYAVGDYWLANAQVAFGPDDGRWELALWGRNIFNADYDETRNFFIAPGGVADVAAPGMPATFGARVSVKY
jgi:iron complex outermembrane recepter protein